MEGKELSFFEKAGYSNALESELTAKRVLVGWREAKENIRRG